MQTLTIGNVANGQGLHGGSPEFISNADEHR
jgi:hypothetical protein